MRKQLPLSLVLLAGAAALSAQTSPCDSVSNAIQVYFSASKHQRMEDLAKLPDDGYLMVGVQDNLTSDYHGIMVKTDADLQLAWAKEFKHPSNATFLAYRKILPMPSGESYVYGEFFNTNFDTFRPGITKLNADGQVLWSREAPTTGIFSKLIPQADGNLLAVIASEQLIWGNQDYYILALFDPDGSVLWQKAWKTLPNNEEFYVEDAVAAPDGGIYLSGRMRPLNPPTANQHVFLAKADAQGNHLWMKIYGQTDFLTDINTNLTLMPDGNLLMSARYGPVFLAEEEAVLLIRADPDGNISWSRELDTNEFNLGVLFINGIVAKPNGHAVIDFRLYPNLVNLFEINTSGDVQWMESYVLGEFTNDGYGANGFIPDGDGFMAMAGTHIGEWNFSMLRTNAQGHIDDACNQQELTYQMTDVVLNVQDWQMEISPVTIDFDPVTLTETNWSFSRSVVCEAEPMPMQANASLEIVDTDRCVPGSFSFTIEVCNTGLTTLPAGLPLTFYGENPTMEATPALASFSTTEAILPGDCITETWSLPASSGTHFFVVANDDGSQATPFSLDATFVGIVVECVYSDNMDEVLLTPFSPPPPFSLGTDAVLCGDETLTLQAPPGFASLAWSGGSSGDSYSANTEGAHWLVATDSCGNVQSDTLLLGFHPPLSPTLLDTALCPPDTLWLGGMAILPGQSVDIPLTASTGCDSVLSISVEALEAYSELLNLTVIEGDSTLIFGNYESLAGEYVQTFSAANGCDSVVTVLLSLVPNNSRQVYAPNAFSPNKDGQNDTFTLYSDEAAQEILSLQVYHRWGGLVFEAKNFAPSSLGWDGTHDGKALDPGVFVFKAEVLWADGTTGKVQGDVTLLR